MESQESHILTSMLNVDALALVPEDRDGIEAGEAVEDRVCRVTARGVKSDTRSTSHSRIERRYARADRRGFAQWGWLRCCSARAWEPASAGAAAPSSRWVRA
jgi:hypothetical protein